MKKSKQLFLTFLCCMIFLIVACQTSAPPTAVTTPTNEQVAQQAGLPKAALTRLEEILSILSDGDELILKSAQKVTNLEAIFELYPSIQAEEIWCTLWQSNEFTWGLGVFRHEDEWVDAFNGFMSPNNEINVQHAEVWQEAGCSNFLDL